MTEVVLEAVSAFRRGAYVLAESLFGECQKKYGSKFFSPNVSVVKNRIIRKFVSGDVPPSLDPMVYYCIPVMNRLEDIQTTLRHNLSVLEDRKSTRLNSSHVAISYAVFCLKKKT